jgi:hypothetical protein
MSTIFATVDPVTFDGPDDPVGLVHRYADHDTTYLATACGLPLASYTTPSRTTSKPSVPRSRPASKP